MGFFKTTNAPERFPAKIFLPDNLIETRRTVRKTSQMGYVHPAATVPNFSIELGEWFSWALNNNIIVWDNTPYVDTNIYVGDGSLISERTLTHDGFDMLFDTGTDSKFTVGGNDTFVEVDGQNQYIRIGDISNGIGDSNGIFIDNTNGIVAFGDAADDGTITVGIQSEVSTGYVTDYGIRRFTDYGLGVNTDVNLSKIASNYAAIFATDGTILEVDLNMIGGDPAQNLWLEFVADSGSTSADNLTDVLTVTGGTGITTAIVGDTLTITNDDPNELHTGEVVSTSPTALIAHETIISNKTLVVGVPGDYMLLWDATDTSLKKVDFGQLITLSLQNLWETITSDSGSTAANSPTDTLNILGGTGILTSIVGDTLTITYDAATSDQNLWETIVSDSGSTVANTTTDTLNIVGGTGIATAIVGDTLTITNVGVGATYTASNGLLLSTADFRLGGTAAGGGTWDFTEDRYLYTDTFNFILESAGGFFGRFDATSGFTLLGNDEEPQAQLHVILQGQIPSGDGSGPDVLAIFENNANTTAIGEIRVFGGNDGGGKISFEESGVLHIIGDNDNGILRISVGGDYVASFYNVSGPEVGLVAFDQYGVGTFLDTPIYALGVLADGSVIEFDTSSLAYTASNGIIINSSDIRLGGTVAAGGTWDFVENRFLYTDTFDLTFESANGFFARMIGSSGFTTIGSNDTADATLHVVRQGQSGGGLTTVGDEVAIFEATDGTNASIAIVSDDDDRSLLYFGIATKSDSASISYYEGAERLYFAVKNLDVMWMNDDGSIRVPEYGIGSFTGTPTYLLAVDADGDVIEIATSGGLQNLWLTIVGDSGTTTANTATDALSILGGTGVTTTISGDTVTIDFDISAAANIYNTSDSLTGNRVLTGGTFDLEFNFDNGANVSNQTWTDTVQSREVSNATGTNVQTYDFDTFRQLLTTTSGGDNSFLEMSPIFITLGKIDVGLSQQNIGMSGTSLSLASDSITTGEWARLQLDAGTAVTSTVTLSGQTTTMTLLGTSATMAVTSSGADSSIKIINTGATTEIRFASAGLAAANNGYVWTLIDDTDGHGEWQAAPSGPNLWATFTADTGNTTANTTTDTFNIVGGTDITTTISGDTITIDWTGSVGADTNIYNTSGTLTANRNVALSTFGLTIDGLTSNNIYTKWDETNNRWYTYNLSGSQYLGLKVGSNSAAEVGAWQSSLDSTTNNKLLADANGVGLYRYAAGVNTTYVKVLDTGSGEVELYSDSSGYNSTLNMNGPITELTSIGIGGTSYAKIITTGSAIANSNKIDLIVYDGGSDTTSIEINDTKTIVSSGWADTSVKTDATARNIDHHNYNPVDLDKTRSIRYNCTGFHTLSGIVSSHTEEGSILEIWNIGTADFNLLHEDAGSSAINRFLCPNNSAYRVANNAGVILRYDATSQRWRILAGTV